MLELVHMRLRSSVVERLSRKQEVTSSNLVGGFGFKSVKYKKKEKSLGGG